MVCRSTLYVGPESGTWLECVSLGASTALVPRISSLAKPFAQRWCIHRMIRTRTSRRFSPPPRDKMLACITRPAFPSPCGPEGRSSSSPSRHCLPCDHHRLRHTLSAVLSKCSSVDFFFNCCGRFARRETQVGRSSISGGGVARQAESVRVATERDQWGRYGLFVHT